MWNVAVIWSFLAALPLIVKSSIQIGNCTAELVFDKDVDLSKIEYFGATPVNLIKSYSGLSPLQCVTGCCNTGEDSIMVA